MESLIFWHSEASCVLEVEHSQLMFHTGAALGFTVIFLQETLALELQSEDSPLAVTPLAVSSSLASRAAPADDWGW